MWSYNSDYIHAIDFYCMKTAGASLQASETWRCSEALHQTFKSLSFLFHFFFFAVMLSGSATSSPYSFTVPFERDLELKRHRFPLKGPNLSSLPPTQTHTHTPPCIPAGHSGALLPLWGPPFSSLTTRDLLTPQPPAYQLWLTGTQTDGIILLHRLHWGGGSKGLSLWRHSAHTPLPEAAGEALLMKQDWFKESAGRSIDSTIDDSLWLQV